MNYTTQELSAIFSNLAKGSEKQHQMELSDLYLQLSDYYKKKSAADGNRGFEDLQDLLEKDLTESFASANEIAEKNSDRGALRALKWAEKVSKIIKSHLKKGASGSLEFLENTNLYVCEICGFMYAGDEKPEVCPVCKVPNFKMTEIKGGA